MLPAFFIWMLSYGHGMAYVVVVVALGVCTLGAFFGRFFAGPKWLAATSVCLPYVLLIGNFLYHALSSDGYYGVSWWREFSLIPALAYISPLCLAYLGVRLGEKLSIASALPIPVVLLLLIVGVSTVESKRGTVSSTDVSFSLLESDDIQLWANMRCTYVRKRDYWEFRNLDRSDCGRLIITLGRKSPTISLPTTAYWMINGSKIEHQPSAEYISAEDLPDHPKGFDKTIGWRTWFPFKEARNAEDVELRWGEINVNFTDPNSNHMTRLKDTLKRLETGQE